MTIFQRLFWLVALIGLLLPACGTQATPVLGVAGQPTLVFIYTDG